VCHKIFVWNLVAVHNIKEFLTLNTPAYFGMAILDLWKRLMFGFYNNYEKGTLLFTDADSLTYELETNDLYVDVCKDKHSVDLRACNWK